MRKAPSLPRHRVPLLALALTAPLMLGAAPDLTPAQEAEVAAAERDPVVGASLGEVMRLRFEGACQARTAAIARGQRDLRPARRERPERLTAAEWRTAFDRARTSFDAEAARTCTPAADDARLADAATRLPRLSPITSEAPPQIADAIRAGNYDPGDHGYAPKLAAIFADTRRCEVPVAQAYLSVWRAIVTMLGQSADRARMKGAFAQVDPETAERVFRAEQRDFDAAELEFLRYRAACAKLLGPAPPPRATVAAPVTAAPAPAPAGWGLLLGRWRNVQQGTEIELRLDADGTMSGIIVAAGPRAMAQGYAPGLVILRGFKLGAPFGSRRAIATGGSYFLPPMPGRRAHELYGTPSWDEGVIYLLKGDPDQLELPTPMESRMNAYGGMRR